MKKFLALALALTMILAVTGCGSKPAAPAAPAVPAAPAAPAASAAPAAPAAPAKADWPGKQVQLYLPLKAGGGTDVLLRHIADGMNKNTGSSFVVVNQNEGGGAVCFNNVEHTKPNGDILGFYGSSFFTSYVAGSHESAPTKFRCASFLEMTSGGSFIVVPASSPYKTFEELIEGAKSKELVLGIQLGSYTHFQCAEIAQNAGINFKYVEATGDAEKVTALLGGLLDVSLVNANQTKQYVESGDLRALCCVSDFDREALAPLKDVPTLEDLGYPKCKAASVFVCCVPESTDDALVAAINSTFAESVARDDVAENLMKMGYVLKAHDVEGSQKMYDDAYGAFRNIGADLGILAEGR